MAARAFAHLGSCATLNRAIIIAAGGGCAAQFDSGAHATEGWRCESLFYARPRAT
jgi:hypothetical protein